MNIMPYNSRKIVLNIITDVLEEKKPSHIVIKNEQDKLGYASADNVNKAFIKRVSKGTIERKITLDYIIDQYSNTPVKKMKPFIRELLRMSVYQIMYMDHIPDRAACNEAVKIVKESNFRNLSSFVNGVLRTISREKNNIKYPEKSDDIYKYMEIRYSIPEWLVKFLIEENGISNTEEMLDCLFRDSDSISVRVNVSKMAFEDVVELLKKDKVEVEITPLADNIIILKNPGDIKRLKAFKMGLIQPQDISAAYVSQVAGVKPGMMVIDLCGAPGGKTLHVADLMNNTGKIISRDIYEHKIELIRENANRCGFTNIETEIFSATEYDDKYEGKADLVIADVPCSGLGVMKKKSDIKYNIKTDNIFELAEMSVSILTNAVKYLKKGGILIFSTCTITKEENDYIREWLLETFDMETSDITDYLSDEILQIGNNKDTAKEGFLKLFITEKYDGFYISKYIKK